MIFSLPIIRRPAVVPMIMAGLLLTAFVVPELVPSVEAATSRDKKKISKLKKTVKKLKRQLLTQRTILVPAGGPETTPEAPFIEMVTVGNPGNGNDPEDGDINDLDAKQNFGAVAAAFQIGKYEVTNAQYAAFLNAVAAADPNGLFDARMESNSRGGIDQFGASPNFRYAVRAGMGDKPVIYVDFWDCCRFCNWMHNGMPSGDQDDTTTEDGAYTLLSTNPTNDTVDRNPGAKFHLPTEDQWYKAAYHQPAAAGGDTDDYWLYPTRANDPDAPTEGTVNAIGEITNDDGNIANYNFGADWDSNGDEVNENGNVTAVGSGGPGSASAYGGFDMAGNVWEWNETIILTSFRGLRGGSWLNDESFLRSSLRGLDFPGFGLDNVGFRVASP